MDVSIVHNNTIIVCVHLASITISFEIVNMAVPIFMRFSNLHNLLRINNNVVCTSSNRTQFLSFILRLSSTTRNAEEDKTKQPTNQMDGLSKAMRAYLERAMQYEKFMKEETIAYETGKRHLANMMGIDFENFTQKDIDKSLEYLFPSGLYDPRARPMMKPPTETFPPQKEAEFGADGKPFHSFFFTRQPNYYQALHESVKVLNSLDYAEDKYIRQHGSYPAESKIDPSKSIWVTKTEIEKRLIETLSDQNYEYFIKMLNQILNHRMSIYAKDFVMKYRQQKIENSNQQSILPVLYDENQRPYVSVFPCQRKSAVAKVIVWGRGTGKITINGEDITYFKHIHTREQVIFPLIFTNMLGKVDIEASVEGGGPTGQSGAIRWGIAWGLRSFLPPNVIDNMKIAGLLTRDWRRRERKKFGQEGARRKFTWKKR